MASSSRVAPIPSDRLQQGEDFIFRPWITRNGRRIYAKDFGLKGKRNFTPTLN